MRGGLGAAVAAALMTMALLATAASASAATDDPSGPTSCLAIAPASLPAAANIDAARRAPGARSVPVWALIDGELPLTGGKATIVTGHGRNRHVIADRGGDTRTNRDGTVVLHPRRVPKRFTVVVRGGEAGGDRFRGSLAIDVTGYRAPGILTVNPVSTIVTAFERAHPELNGGRAEVKVKRYLEIPAFQDVAIDLRRSDAFFDGDVILKRLGGRRMSDLVDKTVARMDRVGRHGTNPFLFSRRAKAERRRLGDVDGAGDAAVADDLVNGLLKNAASAGAGAVGNYLLGFVLEDFGLGGGDPDAAALAAIQNQLTVISQQLGTLEVDSEKTQAAIAKAEYSNLVGQTTQSLGEIDNAETCLGFLVTMDKNDPDLGRFSKGLTNYIGSTLLPIESTLTKQINGVQGADGIVTAAYKDTHAAALNPSTPNFHFWTQQVSAQPRQVFDYFAAYQAELAMLTTEYYHSQDETTDSIVAALNEFQYDIGQEQSLLKPLVPDATVVDAATGEVWLTENEPRCNLVVDGQLVGSALFGHTTDDGYYFQELSGGCGQSLQEKSYRDLYLGDPQVVELNGQQETMLNYVPPFVLPDMPSLQFRAATLADEQGLITNWNQASAPAPVGAPANPYEFMQTYGGFPTFPAPTGAFDPGIGPEFWAWVPNPSDFDPLVENECEVDSLDSCRLFFPQDPSQQVWDQYGDWDGSDAIRANILWVADGPSGGFWY